MSKHPSVQDLIKTYIEKDKLVGMICAGTKASSKIALNMCSYCGFIPLLGSLAAKTAKLPRQKLTSHPSIKADLDQGECSTIPLFDQNFIFV